MRKLLDLIRTDRLTLLKKKRFEISLTAPLVGYIVLLTIIPVMYAIYLSLVDPSSNTLTIRHYREIIFHFQFRQAVFNTLFITLVGLSLELCLGMIMAVILSHSFRGRGVFRAILLISLGVPTIVAAANMRYIFDTSGLLNQTLLRLGLLRVPYDWTQGGMTTLMTVIAADMWKVTPLVMLILLAGIESIPVELYESARIDGASRWKEFWKITLPLLKPSITMALIIRGIDAFRIFELPLILVGRTEPVMSTYAYFEYFEAININTSAAAGTMLLIMILVTIIGYLRIVGTQEVVY
ncbi:MAG: ABC transporter permease subunit [Proteobacteria bacterium]|nr:ABC transporter permease subunit [Pseudomonadota bacterium]NIS72171.1 ABC transporter permease subunit [Pseudomonadota bacterium]